MDANSDPRSALPDDLKEAADCKCSPCCLLVFQQKDTVDTREINSSFSKDFLDMLLGKLGVLFNNGSTKNTASHRALVRNKTTPYKHEGK